ncbi:hypothetical protein GYMLUDRAFT_404491 [Collybiopsis luxurians FD-317 M1]|uniref:Uncharacterized protein n=1 Tax=Collybiopsis luxurians FD-317 M1 TaxID=944289 RepID=A0A0D0C0U4_9AGAR|nr:hypothetical protein GYMLUDRAFT_404491 [Collybiopsis luxurians FD-317 M1]
MRKTAIKVKKFFGKKKNQKATLAGNVASTDAPDSGTASQVPSTYQSDTGPEPGVGVTSQSRTAPSAQPAELGTEFVLAVLKEVSAPFTPLQAAVGGIIECIHIYKKVAGNTEALQALAKDLISHTKLMHEHLNRDDMDVSEWTIIEDLAIKLDGINKRVKEQMQSGNFKNVVQKDQVADRIEGFKREIQDAYQECQVKSRSMSSKIIGLMQFKQMKLISAIKTDTGKILEVNIVSDQCIQKIMA